MKKTYGLRKSLNYSHRNMINQSIDINTSFQFDTPCVLKQSNELQSSSSIMSSSFFTQDSLLNSRFIGFDDNQMKDKKKKIGIQLSILQKNILTQKNQNCNQRPKRLNRSGFIKSRQNSIKLSCINPNNNNSHNNNNTSKNISLNSLTKQNKPQLINKSTILSSSCTNNNSNTKNNNTITSLDLQQIRKLDKDIYKLYLDLYHDYKQELQKQKQNNKIIQQLKQQIQRENQIERVLEQKIQAVKNKQIDCKQSNMKNQENWIKNVRSYMVQHF